MDFERFTTLFGIWPTQTFMYTHARLYSIRIPYIYVYEHERVDRFYVKSPARVRAWSTPVRTKALRVFLLQKYVGYLLWPAVIWTDVKLSRTDGTGESSRICVGRDDYEKNLFKTRQISSRIKCVSTVVSVLNLMAYYHHIRAYLSYNVFARDGFVFVQNPPLPAHPPFCFRPIPFSRYFNLYGIRSYFVNTAVYMYYTILVCTRY